ncbi:MAG: AI-2E family transporter [Caulobacteraceae bacterium]|nr:AI-2E family transporter [Caulobacter sp.]
MPEAPKTKPPGSYRRESAADMTRPQGWASLAAAAALLVAGVFALKEFVPALVWAVILAIAVWPLFDRAGRRFPRLRPALPALTVLGIVLVVVAPLTVVTVPLAADAHGLAAWIAHARAAGVPAPQLLGELPYGQRLTALWQENLGRPGALDTLGSRAAQGSLVDQGRRIGGEALHRVVLLGFALLALFLLLREAEAVVAQVRAASRRAFGEAGERVGRQMVLSVHGTVNGLVLVGLVEGAVMTVAYFVSGTPHASLFGLLTAILAMIPLGATVALAVVAVVLLAVNKVVAAVVIVVLGGAVTFVGDHFFRPVLIGGATRLPFLWVLLGILGGVSAFGLMGLFVGPAVLAALILLWREWIGSEPGPLNPVEGET